MSSHQCCLRGALDIKPDATDELIATALEPFLEAYGLDYNRELVSGAIEILDNRRQLTLSLEFQGDRGGYINTGIEETIGRLNRLVDGHGYLEMVDYDTAATESMVTPFFVGAELRERNHARIHYAIDQATPWLESTLEAGAVRLIRDYILSFQPRGTPCTSLPAGESMRTDRALPATTHSTTSKMQDFSLTPGLTGTVLEDIYNRAGDGEHPVFSRAMWREAVAKQDTASGYWDWTEHQIAEATEPAQG